jgi:CubicO group peptidase (beta-lactamase class C family)
MAEARTYFPGRGIWKRIEPREAGFDPDRLESAVTNAIESEIKWPQDMNVIIGSIDRPPYNKPLGPVKKRGRATGLVVKNGYQVASWGDPERIDMTFSATKSFISILIGLAVDRGLIKSVDDPVVEYVQHDSFKTNQNRRITWKHLLQQTSEWEGELFGIPDTVDHNRSVQGGADRTVKKGDKRALQAPGSYWEYNDVRVNVLALAALYVFKEPLPRVLAREIMQPVGASDTWEWHAYNNAEVTIEGKKMYSVPGGAHWGGGLFINTLDLARAGYLMLRRGNWNGRQLISQDWIDQSLTTCPLNPGYGYMWWLNNEKRMVGSASEKAFAAMGAGGNVVLMDPQFDLVIVTRWTQDQGKVIDGIVLSLNNS